MSSHATRVTQGVVSGAFAGVAIMYALDWLTPKEETSESKARNIVRRLDPMPESMHIDPEMVDIFEVISRYRTYNEKAYIRCQKNADRICLITMRLDDGSLVASMRLKKEVERYSNTCLNELKDIYKAVKNSEKDDIERREKAAQWREYAKTISRSAAVADKEEKEKEEETDKKGKKDVETLKEKLKHDIVKMYYGLLNNRIVEHVREIVRQCHQSELRPRA